MTYDLVSVGALTCLCLVSLSCARTIDEMIASASSSANIFDIMDDINSPTSLVELDMVLTRQQYNQLLGLSVNSQDEPEDHPRSKRKAIREAVYRWPNGELPYKIEPSIFTIEQLVQITLAMKEWGTHTCIRFVPVDSSDKDYVVFEDGTGCSSYVGKSGGRHPIKLAGGCRVKGVIAHEMGHAVGFFHEQNRPDRDQYITIQKENIIHPNLYHNFEKYPWSAVSSYDVPYDYRSIMHYGGRAFSGNGQYTIKTRDSAYQEVIGNREGLSFGDIKLANLMYECNKGCDSSIRCPGEGFVGKDCKCYCPGTPVQVCGDEVRTTAKPTTVVSTTSQCEDMNSECPGWARVGYCKTNDYVMTYCHRSCNMCDASTVPARACVNHKEDCHYWAGVGHCTGGMYEYFMSQNCPLACDLCNADTGHSTTPAAAVFSSTSANTGDSNEKNNVATSMSQNFVLVIFLSLCCCLFQTCSSLVK